MITKKHNNIETAKTALALQNFKDNIFSTETTRKVCKIPYKKLSDWDRKGILPHQKREVAEGWRTFDFNDLLMIKIILFLRENGAAVHNIKKFNKWFDDKKRISDIIHNVTREDLYIATNLTDKHLTLSRDSINDRIVELAETSVFIFKLNHLFEDLLSDLSKKFKN